MKPLSTEIQTERLLLRPFREDDSQQVFSNWHSDPKVFLYLDQMPAEEPKQSREYCHERTLYYRIPYFFDWAIIEKSTGKLIGEFNASYSRKRNSADIGYCIGSMWWNKGYMSELVPVMCEFFLGQAGISTICAECAVNNIASRRVLEKSGFILRNYNAAMKLYFYQFDPNKRCAQ